jgi:hypothetical protein
VAVDVFIEGTVRLHAVANEQGLLLQGRGVRLDVPWDEVTGAGLVRVRTIDVAAGEPGTAKLLPGMGRLSAAAAELARRNRLLVIGRSRGHGRARAVTVPLPAEDADVRRLLAEVRERLGPRWRGDDCDQRALRKELGAAYPLWYWPAGALFVVVVGAVALLATAAWGFLLDPEGRADLADARWWTFAGLAAWLGLCAFLLLVARRAGGGGPAGRFAAPIPVVLLLAVLTPPAVATLALIDEWRFSDLEPAPLVALALWLGLLVLATRLLRKLLD